MMAATSPIPASDGFLRALALAQDAHDAEVRQLRWELEELRSRLVARVAGTRGSPCARASCRKVREPGGDRDELHYDCEPDSSGSDSGIVQKSSPDPSASTGIAVDSDREDVGLMCSKAITPVQESDEVEALQNERGEFTSSEDNGASKRVFASLCAGSAKPLLAMCFQSWRSYTTKICLGVINDDDDEIELLKKEALEKWAMRYSEGAFVSHDTQHHQDTDAMSTSITSSRRRRFSGTSMQHRFLDLVIRPSSRTRMLWIYCGLTLLSYDTLAIPLLAAFDFEASPFLTLMTAVTSAFWSLDIFMSFITGFHIEGIVEMRLEAIAQNYLRTWFVPDCVLVVLDWTFLTLTTVGLPLQNPGQFLRLTRLMRLVRSLKIFPRLLELFEEVESVENKFLKLLLRLVRSVVIIVIVNHFVACMWYAIARFNNNAHETWLSKAGFTDSDGRGELFYSYLTSLHWAFCQVTPASMEVHPQNAAERGFTLCIIVLGMMMFSSFISSITNTMTQLRNIEAERIMQETAMYRFIEQHKLSAETGRCIVHWQKTNRVCSEQLLHHEDVPVLQGLPASLRSKLLGEVYSPVVSRHPLFKEFADAAPVFMRRICDLAISEIRLEEGQELFSKGSKADSVLFVRTGSISYSMGVVDEQLVHSQGWLCEIALWCPWEHRGTASGKRLSELLALNANLFHEVLAHSPKFLQRFVRCYAASFVRHDCIGDCHVNGGVNWLTDICCPRHIITDLVQNTQEHVHIVASRCMSSLHEANVAVTEEYVTPSE